MTHKLVQPLEAFLGTWRGEGIGFYPTIKTFKYVQEATFSTWGKPVIHYMHRTWNAETNTPMHHESGYLRTRENFKLEYVNAQPTGVTEVNEGMFEQSTKAIELFSKNITRVATAKEPHVVTTKRIFQLKDPDTLLVYFDMATSNQPLQRHLEAELHRVKSLS